MTNGQRILGILVAIGAGVVCAGHVWSPRQAPHAGPQAVVRLEPVALSDRGLHGPAPAGGRTGELSPPSYVDQPSAAEIEELLARFNEDLGEEGVAITRADLQYALQDETGWRRPAANAGYDVDGERP
jgi:hypothetical protein